MDFRINDSKIDAEHATILQLLDSFLQLPDTIDAADVRTMLRDLKDHVVVHFIDEEFIFGTQYQMPPDYVAFHEKEHIEIRHEVLETIAALQNAGRPELLAGVTRIRELIERHIREVDARMNDYLPG